MKQRHRVMHSMEVSQGKNGILRAAATRENDKRASLGRANTFVGRHTKAR